MTFMSSGPSPLLMFSLLLLTLTAIALHRLHLLSLLLLLEALSLLTLLSALTTVAYLNPAPIMFMLSLIVCEAAMGLSLFMLLTRHTGNDLMKTSSLMKW